MKIVERLRFSAMEAADYIEMLEQFVRLVETMRVSQRAYFETRSTSALMHSKAMEQRVDSAIIQQGTLL